MTVLHIDPKLMCNKHLKKEHANLHAAEKLIVKYRETDLVKMCYGGAVDPSQIHAQHTAVAVEMRKRKMWHGTGMTGNRELRSFFQAIGRQHLWEVDLDTEENARILFDECKDCMKRGTDVMMNLDFNLWLNTDRKSSALWQKFQREKRSVRAAKMPDTTELRRFMLFAWNEWQSEKGTKLRFDFGRKV